VGRKPYLFGEELNLEVPPFVSKRMLLLIIMLIVLMSQLLIAEESGVVVQILLIDGLVYVLRVTSRENRKKCLN